MTNPETLFLLTSLTKLIFWKADTVEGRAEAKRETARNFNLSGYCYISDLTLTCSVLNQCFFTLLLLGGCF